MKTHTFYEFPLNERVRTFIRLEQLFLQLDYFTNGSSSYDSRAAISVLLDVLVILGLSDLKSGALKELSRHASTLNQIVTHQGTRADTEKLGQVLDDINSISKKLHASNRKIVTSIMESDWFQSISQRHSIPGGTCSFDLPAFHFWLEQENSVQQKDLKQWAEPFADIRTAINLILNLIRQSSTPTQEIAKAGLFQLSLDKSRPPQLLIVGVDSSLSCFAKISGGRHRCAIRYMIPSSDNSCSAHVSVDVPFTLTLCLF